jgi:hypothetical protein
MQNIWLVLDLSTTPAWYNIQEVQFACQYASRENSKCTDYKHSKNMWAIYDVRD